MPVAIIARSGSQSRRITRINTLPSGAAKAI